MNWTPRLPLFTFLCIVGAALYTHRTSAEDSVSRPAKESHLLPANSILQIGDVKVSMADMLSGDQFISSSVRPPAWLGGRRIGDASRLDKRSTVFPNIWRTVDADSPIRISFQVSSRYETSSALTRLAEQVTAELGQPDSEKRIGQRSVHNSNNKQVFTWDRRVEGGHHLTLSIREDPNTLVLEIRTIANW